MIKVLVLGGSGMLGSMVIDVLGRDPSLAVTATVRDERWLRRVAGLPRVTWRVFSADGHRGLEVIEGHDWVVNCIGITKPLIRDDNPLEVERAIRVNSLFPYVLADWAADVRARVIQIATDCVYSGAHGRYVEADVHDALDVYGKSKSLGEVRREHVCNLRCSIIGPEPKYFKFLLEWFLHLPPRTEVEGFTNHLWNGLTTLHFARLCLGIIKTPQDLPSLQHVFPADVMTKADMLRAFATAFRREDLMINDVEAGVRIDRTLSTSHPAHNEVLWGQAGYDRSPTVGEMIRELSQFDYRLREVA